MTMYVLDGAQRRRLGVVTGNSTTHFTIPDYLIRGGSAPLRFLADPIGGQRLPVTESIVVVPGDTVQITIPSELNAVHVFEIVIVLLLIGAALGGWARRIGAPYPALMALAGAALALMPGTPAGQLSIRSWRSRSSWRPCCWTRRSTRRPATSRRTGGRSRGSP